MRLCFEDLLVGLLTFGVGFNLWMWLGFGFDVNAVFAGICAFYLVITFILLWRGRKEDIAFSRYMEGLIAERHNRKGLTN